MNPPLHRHFLLVCSIHSFPCRSKKTLGDEAQARPLGNKCTVDKEAGVISRGFGLKADSEADAIKIFNSKIKVQYLAQHQHAKPLTCWHRDFGCWLACVLVLCSELNYVLCCFLALLFSARPSGL